MDKSLIRNAIGRRTRRQRRGWRQVGDVRGFESRRFSQNGEDGIIEEILRRIGTDTRYFVEFGVETGVECNCAALARLQGWRGLFIEADPAMSEQLRQNYRSFPEVSCAESFVTSANIEDLLEKYRVPAQFDVLSIDIDGNDYWVWRAIHQWRPRLAVVEYNASKAPLDRWVMAENSQHQWDGTSYFGASLASLMALGRQKGYTLVGTTSNGVNAFFVRDDLIQDRFPDAALLYHYSPPRYGFWAGGHRRRNGPHVAA